MDCPKSLSPKGQTLAPQKLEIWNDSPSKQVQMMREEYTIIALLMFYPFQTDDDLKQDGSYWKVFNAERLLCCKQSQGMTKFLENRFHILQNIQDRITVNRKMHCARDTITLNTLSVGLSKSQSLLEDKGNNKQLMDISDFYDNYE